MDGLMDGRQIRLFLFFFSILSLMDAIHAQRYDYPTANLSTVWINGPNIDHTIKYDGDGSIIKALLLRQGPGFYGPSFACGFYCRNGDTTPCNSFLFAIFIVYTNSGGLITMPTMAFPQVVWSANRNRPIGENATLELTRDGDLILKDVGGELAWSTNTSGKSVVGMNLTDEGNLVLVGGDGEAVWQSFGHPTDALVPGQKLLQDQRLIANVSMSNWTEGQLYLSATSGGWAAFANSRPPQLYHSVGSDGGSHGNKPRYVMLTNGSLGFFVNSKEDSDTRIDLPPASSLQYLRLEYDGHLRLYEWKGSPDGWTSVGELIKKYLGKCAYPTVCGRYGICSGGGQCRCPQNSSGNGIYFKATSDRSPDLGCTTVTPLSCQSLQDHHFLILKDVSYFNYFDPKAAISNLTTEESCKEACLKNCSCKAALFQYGWDPSSGTCYLPSEIYSLMNNERDRSHYNSTAYIKVQVKTVPRESNDSSTTVRSESKATPVATLAGAILGGLVGLFLIVGAAVAFLKARNKAEEREDEDDFDQLPGMPTRFSHEELKVATNNFSQKLGEGGFGSVFKGTSADGAMIAVKRLDGVGQGKREFLSEVETIGSVHHVRLVRLVGFCAERSQRLLVYEYMCNGSLDKWIFQTDHPRLNWETKRKIINHVATGLMYLHEQCRQRIAHLDIKPQNILLDENFDAKVSDFGLSKLIDKDQSSVMTRMTGTPGYLAPEWLTSVITEKVDVYSFGVVVIEIVCGRKNLDHSQPEEKMHLLSVLKDKAEQGRIIEFVREHCRHLETDEKDASDMIRLAIWCLQGDASRRPSMSAVVKVLEGTLHVDPNLDYNFFMHKSEQMPPSKDSSPLLASVLSGPR